MADHIQIGDISPRIQYTGDGVQTAFPYPFPVFLDADLEVYKDANLASITTDYSVAGAGDSNGGTVTFVTAPANGVVVTLRRQLTIERTSDFQESGEFRAKVINDDLDFLTAAVQQVAEGTGRAVQLAPTDVTASVVLPEKNDRAGRFLAFDAAGDAMASAGSADGLAVSGFIETLLDDADAGAARTTLGLGTAATKNTGTANGDVVMLDTTGLPAVDGSQLTGIATGTTDAERANIILNAFRVQQALGLAAYDMVAMVADEFEDETGVDTGTSTNETYDATDDYYHNNAAMTQIPQATGTAIGDMTLDGGLASVFDSVTIQAYASAARKDGTDGYVGKDYSSSAKKAGKVIVYGTSDLGYANTTGGSITIEYRGKNSSGPSSSSDGTLLGTITFTDNNTTNSQTITSSDTTTAWDYQWVRVIESSAANVRIAEAEFYEAGTPPDITLQSNAFTATSVPTEAFGVVWIDPVDTVTLNTDIKFWASMDDGSTWTQLTLAEVMDDGTLKVLTCSGSLTSTSGTSMKWKITTHNNKELRIHGVALEWS